MKPPKKPLKRPEPRWNTGHPVPPEDLNQDRLRAVEEGRIEHLPHYITHLENRLVSLHKQIKKAEKLLHNAKKEMEERGMKP